MVLPRWSQTRSQPIAIDDVVAALAESLRVPDEEVGCYDLPGPEILRAQEILFRVAAMRGSHPIALNVPVLSPKLSSYWLRFVTRANYHVAQELVLGLTSDLVAPDDGFWRLMPDYRRTPFDVAARRALEAEESTVPLRGRAYEAIVRRFTRRTGPKEP